MIKLTSRVLLLAASRGNIIVALDMEACFQRDMFLILWATEEFLWHLLWFELMY